MSHEYAPKSPHPASRSAAEEAGHGRRMPAAPVLSSLPPLQKMSKTNNTGLPDNLKSGLEQMSGISMDDVTVHYNSDKPAQLQAHAYAQGNQIHIAPGQEQHLPHEGWHVVQQKQGRVSPTSQLKSAIPINDDKGLEKEADVMGAQALQMKENKSPDLAPGSASTNSSPDIVQRTAFHDEQRKRWQLLEAGKLPPGKFITTGLEYDIGETSKDNPLQGIAHLELMKGNNGFPLPYILETDAGNTLELVTPPYLLETVAPDKPFPAVKAVQQAIGEDNAAISAAFKKKQTINKTATGLADSLGITWKASPLALAPSNLSLRANIPEARKAVKQHNELLLEKLKKQTPSPSSNIVAPTSIPVPLSVPVPEAAKKQEVLPEAESGKDKAPLTEVHPAESIPIPVAKEEKTKEPEEPSLTIESGQTMNGSNILGISVVPTPGDYSKPQINVLTSARHFNVINQPGQSRLLGKKSESIYLTIIKEMMDTAIADLQWLSAPPSIAAKEPMEAMAVPVKVPKHAIIRIAETITHEALDSMRIKVIEYQAILQSDTALNTGQQKVFEPFANLISYIKDYSNAWLKTDLLTYLTGALTKEELGALLTVIEAKCGTGLYNTAHKYISFEELVASDLDKHPSLKLAMSWFDKNGTDYKKAAAIVMGEVLKLKPGAMARAKFKRPELFGKDPNTVGIRHDTFIDQNNLNELTGKLGYKEALHVVEIRAHGEDTIYSGQKV